MPPPSHILYLTKPTRGLPEGNRRRKDQKVPGAYRRLLAFTNRTFGRYSEWAEVNDAWQNNPDPAAFLTALAANQAIDVAYGARAQVLKSQIYDREFYRLPFGLEFITSPGYR